jgi:hypothetical protein
MSDEIVGKATAARNTATAARGANDPGMMDVTGVTRAVREGGGEVGSKTRLLQALDKSHTTRIKFATLISAGIGALTGAVDPDKSIIGEAAKLAAEGFLFETFMPTMAYLYMASEIGRVGASVAGNISRGGAERMHHVMSGRGLYSQHDPSANQFAGNLRRQSLGYMMQSRQNTRSFIGSEATYMHATS